MSHWLGIVIVPPDTPNIEKKVMEMLAPFDLQGYAEVDLHREYFRSWQVASFKKQLGTDDLSAIAEHLRQTPIWNQQGAPGLDEHGLYFMVSFNRLGQWDDWVFSGGEDMIGEGRFKECLAEHNAVGGREEPFACNMCRIADLPEKYIPWSIVTPDRTWHSQEDFVDQSDPDNPPADFDKTAWRDYVRGVFTTYPDHIAVGVYFHG